MGAYAKPEVLVETDWVDQHRNDPKIKLVEVDVEIEAYYEDGHIPGAIAFNWTTQLQDPTRRDIPSQEQFEKLLSEAGISNDDTIVLYGDNNNWFAAYAYWLLKMYGHEDVRLMNGGRKKWLAEKRELTTEVPKPEPTNYQAKPLDDSIRAMQPLVYESIGKRPMIDVRSPQEFSGDVIAPPGMTETAQRGGHIPGAKNVPWSTAVNEDGTFKSPAELRQIYIEGAGVKPEDEVIAYCRIGERSSHTWFVLRELLGFKDVRNYDGSWTEWGSMVGVPVERA